MPTLHPCHTPYAHHPTPTSNGQRANSQCPLRSACYRRSACCVRARCVEDGEDWLRVCEDSGVGIGVSCAGESHDYRAVAARTTHQRHVPASPRRPCQLNHARTKKRILTPTGTRPPFAAHELRLFLGLRAERHCSPPIRHLKLSYPSILTHFREKNTPRTRQSSYFWKLNFQEMHAQPTSPAILTPAITQF